MIKFEHSVFALPFALTGALLAARYAPIAGVAPGWPSGGGKSPGSSLPWSGARSFAMTVNRIIDLRYDRENPRTRTRALATGALSVQFRVGLRRDRCRGAGRFSSGAIEPAGAGTCACRARRSCFFIPTPSASRRGHPGSGLLPGNVPGGRVDRYCRLARCAHADPVRVR